MTQIDHPELPVTTGSLRASRLEHVTKKQTAEQAFRDLTEARQCVHVSLEVCFDAWPLEPAAELQSLDILNGGRVNAQAIFPTVSRMKFRRRLSSTRINFPESGCDPRRGLSGRRPGRRAFSSLTFTRSHRRVGGAPFGGNAAFLRESDMAHCASPFALPSERVKEIFNADDQNP